LSDYPFDPASVAPRLLAWYGHEGRDLPWRRTRDPYRIWLSEVMLQQTTVAAVVPYYESFLALFPTVDDLAAAPIEEVIAAWAGLGYYSRARNLHAAAQKVVSEFDGTFPDDLSHLQSLPGVGRSTAGAILSIAFDKKGPILDGNVRRVLCRLFALLDGPRSAPSEKKLWGWAEALTPVDRPHDYAQAIMDLGATVCTPRAPLCVGCPLSDLCRARALDLTEEIPAKRQTKGAPTRTEAALILMRGEDVLIRRRPYEGLLGGMWEFPCASVAPEEPPVETAERLLRAFAEDGEPVAIGRVRHAYSHFRLDLHVFVARISRPLPLVAEDGSTWKTPDELAVAPLHGAHKKAFALVVDALID